MKKLWISIGLVFGFAWGTFSPLKAEDSALRLYSFREQLGSDKIRIELYAAEHTQAQQQADALLKAMRLRARQLLTLQKRLQPRLESHIQLDADESHLFERLLHYCDASARRFDFTDYPLREIWGFVDSSLSYQVPDSQELTRALNKVNCTAYRLENIPPSLQWESDRQISWQLFRQGWLLSALLPVLSKEQVAAASIQMDTVSYYHGIPPGAKAWKVPIPHPREADRLMSYLYLKDQALAQLGDYQDYFMHNGLRYSSLLDARTGRPNAQTIAVFVATANPLEAELIAQVVSRLNAEQIPPFLAQAKPRAVYKIEEQNGILTPQRY